MRRIQILLALTLIISVCLNLFTVSTASAAPLANVTGDQPVIQFPNTVTFRAKITASANITSVVLEYGTKQLTCGDVIAKAFPEVSPSKSVDAQWTWDMRQSGSLPPGATIWWRWRYADETGKETISDQKTVNWLDSEHNWKTINKDKINLHWYSGDQTFAQDLLNAAQGGLDFNRTKSGLVAEVPIDIYIFANTNDLRDAVLYEPSWTGGLAFPEHNIVIIGISPDELDWGRDAIVHELTHVLVGHLTFSCLSDVPTWLNEGLAVYSEGELDKASQAQLNDSIKNDSLLTIRSLSAGFSEVSDKAYLSYSQSFSVVKFLIETYGQDKMTSLLIALRDGATTDEALSQTYSFNIDGLETEWRKAIGAQPGTASTEPTTQPTPTYVPTIVPVSGAPMANQIISTPIPTSSVSVQPTDQTPTRGTPPLSLTIALLCFCIIFLLIFGVIILGFVVRGQNIKAGKHDKA
jgi:hypothetical protein